MEAWRDARIATVAAARGFRAAGRSATAAVGRALRRAFGARWGAWAGPALVGASLLAAAAAFPPTREAAVGVWTGVRDGLAAQPEHRIRYVEVAGRQRLSLQTIAEAAAPTASAASTLAFDVDAARARVEALGWVRRAAVTVLPPHTLSVVVEERRAAARWRVGGDLFLIDRSGAVIAPLRAAEPRVDDTADIATASVVSAAFDAAEPLEEWAATPLVLGRGAERALGEALALERRLRAAGLRSVGWSRVARRRWDLHLLAGPVVALPEEDPAAALDRLALWVRETDLLSHGFALIDLRDSGAPIGRYGADD